MVSDVPLVRELGGGRVQLELAEELRRLGHHVESFDSRDAFGTRAPRRRDRLRPLRFSHAAREFVRAHGARFDVIDAQQGALPYAKQELGFSGLLIARSVGLYAFYAEWRRIERRRWRRLLPGTWVGREVQAVVDRRAEAASRESLERADLVLLPNDEEREWVRERLGLDAALVLPFGLSEQRARAFSAQAMPAERRLERRTVAVVGAWALRKGAADWPEIIRLTCRRVPDVRFLFLGTGRPSAEVKAALGLAASTCAEVMPFYVSDELPSLLAEATVAGFASYVEGWPFGLMETLAAGLPTVAYDAPGSRALLHRLEHPLLVGAGDVAAFAELLAQALTLDPERFARLAAEATRFATAFRWPDIAQRTEAAYALGLERLSA